jgi:hypothetical protein
VALVALVWSVLHFTLRPMSALAGAPSEPA